MDAVRAGCTPRFRGSHGVLSGVGILDKDRIPERADVVRIAGEEEVRLIEKSRSVRCGLESISID